MFDKHIPAQVPADVAVCPICRATIHVTDCDGAYYDDDDGREIPDHISIDCETEPDIDGDEWNDWFENHYRHPYTDWLPVWIRVLDWFQGLVARDA